MYTKQDIFRQLEKMNVPRDKVVLVHTAMRLVGQVEDGAQGFLDVLVEYVTEKGGLLCIPTHTWDRLGTDQITLDMTENHTCLGAFATVALQDGRGIRSENPTHSMVVFGHNAEEFVADETSVTTPCSPYGCYGKVYSQGGYVLLIGTNHKQNTFLHCIDEILQIPDRTDDVTRNFTIRRKDGQIISRPLYFLKCSMGDISRQYHKYDMPFRYYGCITDGFIGNAPTQCCDAVIMKEVLERIWKNCEGTDPLREEKDIPPKWYY